MTIAFQFLVKETDHLLPQHLSGAFGDGEAFKERRDLALNVLAVVEDLTAVNFTAAAVIA
ncbi:hypothetical protein ABFB09_07910 [Dehalogenimonas sp. THU2]|uniref:hypothetical protein n=1 Tax=Dehalogenimonas sp. THU2 TaxID=3151121 RepID=UPI003218A71F